MSEVVEGVVEVGGVVEEVHIFHVYLIKREVLVEEAWAAAVEKAPRARSGARGS